MNKKRNLAIFGGKKTIRFKHPHWKWPPLSKSKIDSIMNYYKSGEKKNSKGYPEIVEKFENNFAKYQNKKYALSMNSGTSSLQAAFFAIGINPGDEIIAPALTFHATASPIYSVDAIPVLADCEPDTGNIDPESISKNITKKTKAIMLPHIYGFPNDMKKIMYICKKHDLYLIEDSSEMIGQKFKNIPCGSFGDISTFSFYANKNITTGEGGMLLTNNKKLNEKIKELRNLSFGKKNRFNHTDLGWNYRFTNIQASLGLSQLKRINNIIKRKREIGKFYYNNFK